jgi:hypothetical protein
VLYLAEINSSQIWRGAKRPARDHRPDCVQVVIALVVTPRGWAERRDAKVQQTQEWPHKQEEALKHPPGRHEALVTSLYPK